MRSEKDQVLVKVVKRAILMLMYAWYIDGAIPLYPLVSFERLHLSTVRWRDRELCRKMDKRQLV